MAAECRRSLPRKAISSYEIARSIGVTRKTAWFMLQRIRLVMQSTDGDQLSGHVDYRRLAPGVLDELRKITVRDEEGRPRHRYFQRLTSNVGYPRLREHLGSVVTLMKLSEQWPDFMNKLDRIHPRYDETMTLALEFPGDDDGKGL